MGGAALADLFDRLAAPFDPAEVRTRRGPRATSSYITARTARRRLNEVLGPDNWSCRIEPAERWVRCASRSSCPTAARSPAKPSVDIRTCPTEEDRVKGGDSDAFKRACVLFGIGEYLYGDEPADPPTPTSNGDGRGEPRHVPRDRISFSNARSFYGWLRDNKYLPLAEEIGNREFFPPKFVDYSPAQIDTTVQEILDRTSRTGGGR